MRFSRMPKRASTPLARERSEIAECVPSAAGSNRRITYETACGRVCRSITSRRPKLCRIFPLWDVVFGTYHHPKRDEYPKTGVVGEPSDASLATIIFGPFIGWTLLKQKYQARTKHR